MRSRCSRVTHLKKVTKNWTRSMMLFCWENAICPGRRGEGPVIVRAAQEVCIRVQAQVQINRLKCAILQTLDPQKRYKSITDCAQCTFKSETKDQNQEDGRVSAGGCKQRAKMHLPLKLNGVCGAMRVVWFVVPMCNLGILNMHLILETSRNGRCLTWLELWKLSELLFRWGKI